MDRTTTQPARVRRLKIAVRGVVQGVGFRPFVYNAARAGNLSGWVLNEADQVRIEVQGEPDALSVFVETLRDRHPPQARIDSIEVSRTASKDGEAAAFRIRTGTAATAPRPIIPADLATCAECLDEVRDPARRRYGYPFTNCTNCGPRWSIIEQLPYDRPRTSMAGFAMCPDCRAEYDDPADRRFHAQPIACPRCGPMLKLLDNHGRASAAGAEALDAAVKAVLAGQIVALKGLGGFQLLVDATSADAVALLRQRKRRPHRPLALMIRSPDEVRRRCELSDEEVRALTSHQAPILLLRRRRAIEGELVDDVCEGVAPGNPYLGVMLPYTPLHHLLIAAVDRPVVCTSGNLSEEPMAIATDDALKRLGPIADVVLGHDRPIVRPVDDSLARVGPDGLQVLRRARGFAPLPIHLVAERAAFRSILAVGGHLKNTVALGIGSDAASAPERQNRGRLSNPADCGPRDWSGSRTDCRRDILPVVLSAHVGDLDNVLSVEVHRRAVRDLTDFFELKPEVVACDLHPDYASTRHAEALAAEWDVPLIRVQHHHAHVAACMAEHQLDGPVLGLAWDGTGYGTDGTVWGGEAVLCGGATFSRAAHLRTFPLPGGDKVVRQPRRSALGLLFEIIGDELLGKGGVRRNVAQWFSRPELTTLLSMLARGVRTPRTSSMGRLFDAVAAFCGLPAVISFEGQAAMALEFAADSRVRDAYPLPVSADTPAVADWEPLLRAVLADRAAGVPVGRISARFHNALAEMAAAVAQAAGCNRVVLTGGCFQNALLTERVRTRLLQEGFSVYTHRQVPPNDGGIALGQVYVAARQAKV